jgi:ABC-type glycerol-3-phosphate transport system substrate-binding protein
MKRRFMSLLLLSLCSRSWPVVRLPPRLRRWTVRCQTVGSGTVLDYYWIGNADTDQRPLVEAAINEYVEPLIGANVTFNIIGWGDWDTKAVTGLQAGETMDIFFTADWYFYMQLATQGLFLPLNDDKAIRQPAGAVWQGILEGLNPAFITGTQIDGVNYAVPTNKELTVPEGFIYNLVTLAEEIGFTPEEAAKIKKPSRYGALARKSQSSSPG